MHLKILTLFLLLSKNVKEISASPSTPVDAAYNQFATGPETVNRVISIIEKQSWYKTDWDFIYNSALVLNNFGKIDPNLYHGDIWRITKPENNNIFQNFKNKCLNEIAEQGSEIAVEDSRVGILENKKCSEIVITDMKKPIYSAVAYYLMIGNNDLTSFENQESLYHSIYGLSGSGFVGKVTADMDAYFLGGLKF